MRKHVFYVFYLQIKVFNIYGWKLIFHMAGDVP